MTAETIAAESSAHRPRQLVLLGGGNAHVRVLSMLAAHPLPGVQVTLVAPYPRQIYPGMVPGYIAGRYTLDDCVLPLEPLVKRTGLRWLRHHVKKLNVQNQTVQLDDASVLHFDWLSVNTGPDQNREQIEQALPGARQHALFVHPIEVFTALWPKVAQMGDARALRVAVIGGSAVGIELALAVRQRLPNAAVTLVCGAAPPGSNYPTKVQQRLLVALRNRRVTVLQDLAVAFREGAVRLGCGADLACDIPLLAVDAQAPVWLTDSELARDEDGLISVDMYQRCTSHRCVFMAGGEGTRKESTLARSAAYALRYGPSLATNLAATVTGGTLVPHTSSAGALDLLACGTRYAVGSWRNSSFEGRWVWWLKDWIDRRLVARLRAGD